MDSESNKAGRVRLYHSIVVGLRRFHLSERGWYKELEAGNLRWRPPLPAFLPSPSLPLWVQTWSTFPRLREFRCGHMTLYSEGARADRRCAFSRPGTERTPRRVFPFLFPFSANWGLHTHRAAGGHTSKTDKSFSLSVSERAAPSTLKQEIGFYWAKP